MLTVMFESPMLRKGVAVIAVLLVAGMVWGAMGFGGAAPTLAADDDPQPTVTAFTHVQTACEVIDPGEQIFVAPYLIITGITQVEIIESDEPRLDGVGLLELSAVINLATGNANIWGTFSLEPDAVDGPWETTFAGQFVLGGFPSGSGFGHGTGDLEGQTIVVDVQDGPPGPNPPCAIVGQQQQGFASGVIIDGLGDDDDDDDDD